MSDCDSSFRMTAFVLKYILVFQYRKLISRLKGCSLPLASGLACDGQTDPDELELLIKLASNIKPPELIVEIGSFRGRSTVALALAARDCGGRVVAVDPYEGLAGNTPVGQGVMHQRVFMINLLLSGASANTSCVNMPSHAAAQSIRQSSVGLLFIDGDHSYESARNDYESWISRVAGNGVIAFHDSVNAHWGSAKFVAELGQSSQLTKVSTVGSITVFRKK